MIPNPGGIIFFALDLTFSAKKPQILTGSDQVFGL